MSGQDKTLLIDIGNSRLKYVLLASGEPLLNINYCQDVSSLLPILQGANKVLLCSVGQTREVQELLALCEQCHTPYQRVFTTKKAFGIHCAYEAVTTLGVDRWMAILAARKISELPLAVIDLGTANTCDIVIADQHTGGWIAPGFELMRDSVIKNTAQVFGDNKTPMQLDLGQTTPDCVSFGCLASQNGFVQMAQEYLASRHQRYHLLITGGGQATLTLTASPNISLHENLVLEGLARFMDA